MAGSHQYKLIFHLQRHIVLTYGAVSHSEKKMSMGGTNSDSVRRTIWWRLSEKWLKRAGNVGNENISDTLPVLSPNPAVIRESSQESTENRPSMTRIFIPCSVSRVWGLLPPAVVILKNSA